MKIYSYKNTAKTLKIIITLAAISIFLSSCSQSEKAKMDDVTKQDTVLSAKTVIKNKLEKYLQTTLNDPKSYEFVSLDFIDSVTYEHNIKEIKSWYQHNLETSKILQNKLEIKTYKSFLLAVDSVQKSLGNNILNQTAAYKLQLTFRAKNAMGGLVLGNEIVQVSPAPEFTLLTVTDDRDKVSYAPNNFPGFTEIYNKIIVPNINK